MQCGGMNPETTRLVVTVIASAVTAISVAGIGLIGTFVSQAKSHRRQITADELKHQRELDAEALRATRARGELAAEECDRLFSVLGREQLAEFNEGRGTPSEEIRERGQDIRDALDAIGAHTAYLPDDLRMRLLFLRDVIHWSEEISRGGHHSSSRYTLVNNAVTRAHSNIARFLRREPLQPEAADPLLIEFAYALARIFDERRWEFAEEIAEDEDAHEKWLERNPSLVAQLTEARASEQPQLEGGRG